MTLAGRLSLGLSSRKAQRHHGSAPVRRTGPAHLKVRPKVAYGIAEDVVVMSHSPRDLESVEAHRLTEPSLCVGITYDGGAPVMVEEIGLTGWFSVPRLGMREPLLHDAKAWPRRLEPGESVVAYFGGELRRHPVLGLMRRAYARSANFETWSGTSPALRRFVKESVAARRETR